MDTGIGDIERNIHRSRARYQSFLIAGSTSAGDLPYRLSSEEFGTLDHPNLPPRNCPARRPYADFLGPPTYADLAPTSADLGTADSPTFTRRNLKWQN